jgi:hypothetical protein
MVVGALCIQMGVVPSFGEPPLSPWRVRRDVGYVLVTSRGQCLAYDKRGRSSYLTHRTRLLMVRWIRHHLRCVGGVDGCQRAASVTSNG